MTRLLNELWLQRGANTPKCRVCVPFARASEERKVASVTGHHLWRYKFFQFSSSHASQFTHCSHTSVCCLAAHIPKVAHTHNPLYHNRRSLPGTYDSEWEALESGCVVVSLLKKLKKGFVRWRYINTYPSEKRSRAFQVLVQAHSSSVTTKRLFVVPVSLSGSVRTDHKCRE